MTHAGLHLRIGIVAPLWVPVPPRTYGGIERHLSLLTDELVRRGHSVTLFASGDSRTRAELQAPVAGGVAEAMDRGEAFFYEHYLHANLAEAVAASHRLDLLHLHVGSPAVPLAALAHAPALHTLHTGVTVDDVWMLDRFPDAAVTALSARQVEPVPEARRQRIAITPYGFDFSTTRAATGPREHLVFLGRMAPHKGPDAAIDVAQQAGVPIRLAGAPVTPDDRDWFAREIEPRIDGTKTVWVGGVDDAGKDELFERAIALVFPIHWEEPFGLVMLEALARGVPVIALRRGSVPEVVEPGATGWYESSADALAQHVAAAARLDRGEVREVTSTRFSLAAMVDRYESLYQSLAARSGAS